MKHKPNFFVIGAVKAGTTSLYHYLMQHPQVYASPIKEPNFFSTDIDTNKFSATYRNNTFTDLDAYFKHKPLKHLQLAFVKEKEQYLQLFSNVKNEKAIGEFSTSYLYSLNAPQNIFEYNPQAKIIVVLRNPIERSFSHYLMAVRFSFTTKDFMASLKEDMDKKEKGWGISEQYIELGMYAKQIEVYQKVFPKEQVKILLYEDLKNPIQLINEVCDFLKLDAHIFSLEKKHNTAAIPKYKFFNKAITTLGIKKKLHAFTPHFIKRGLKKMLFTSKELPQLSNAEKVFLASLYRDEIMHTSKLINRDLSSWLNV